MLAAVRAALPELFHGLSTAIALAATPRCPEQHCHPITNFPEIPRCPDCICQGSTRQAVEEPCIPCGALYFGITELALALLLGLIVGYWVRGQHTVQGQPIARNAPASLLKQHKDSSVQSDATAGPAVPSAAAKAL